MTTYFDQKDQNVNGPQTNIVGDVETLNVGAVTDQTSLISELERLKSQVAEAAKRGDIDQELAAEAEDRVAQARNEASKPSPDRGRFLAHLGQAQDLLKTAAAATGLVTALSKLGEAAQQLF
jgi:hypothetical protein